MNSPENEEKRVPGWLLVAVFVISLLLILTNRFISFFFFIILVAAVVTSVLLFLVLKITTIVSNRLPNPYMNNDATDSSDYSLAKAAVAREDWETAVREYRNYADRYPEDPVPPLQIAFIYRHHLKQEDIALYWFEKVIQIGGNSEAQPVAFLEKMRILCSTDKVEQARELHQEMLKRFPKHPSTQTAGELLKQLQTRKDDDITDNRL